MPLRDHFHPPISHRKGWASVHHSWVVTIVQRLNGSVLTRGFEAEPEAHLGTALSTGVAADEEDTSPSHFEANSNNGTVTTAVRTYTPPAAVISGSVAFTDPDVFEIGVYKQEGGWQLVAAVELVSPANKDRPSSRRAFATKVAAYLQQGVSVVTVDVVTERQANLHADLVELLHLPDSFDWSAPTGLAATNYRVVRENEKPRLDVWPFALAVGEALPTVPLWLGPDLAVPLELDLTYETACESLRIR